MGQLSEIQRRRIAAVLLVIGLVVATLAIADIGPFDDPPTQEERVADAVESFFASAAEADFDAYCAQLTRTARQTVESNAARLLQSDEAIRCVDVLSALPEAFAGARIRIREVSVSGNRARAELNLRTDSEPGIQPRTVLLEELEGEWLISDPG